MDLLWNRHRTKRTHERSGIDSFVEVYDDAGWDDDLFLDSGDEFLTDEVADAVMRSHRAYEHEVVDSLYKIVPSKITVRTETDDTSAGSAPAWPTTSAPHTPE